MVKVEYYKGKNDLYLKTHGHANYNKHGQDIVCSAISILTFTLAKYVSKNCDIETIRMDSGNSLIAVKHCNNHKQWEVIQSNFDMIYEGLEQISRNYPSHIEVNVLL